MNMMNVTVPIGPVPDALSIPGRYKRGRTLGERVDSILAIAEPLLGVDRAAGQRAYIRQQGCGPAIWMFVTRSPDDTLYGPTHSPFRGRPRYDWIDRPDGIRIGYLKDIFRHAEIEPFDPIAHGVYRPPGF
jgi:hypothetical protein